MEIKRHRDDLSCPHCLEESRVEYQGTDELGDETWQYYKCLSCGKRFQERFSMQYLGTVYYEEK